MRVPVTAILATLALAGAAPAHADVGDDCAPLGAQVQSTACHGADVVKRDAEALAADHEPAVAAYERSWTHRALAFQHALGHDVALRDAPWFGTHNSFNSIAEMGPALSTADSNQQLSLVDQLDIDMRSLEIDVHWLPSPRAGDEAARTSGRAPVVCHGRPAREMHAGCTTERLLSEVLMEINDWLNSPEHRREVVLLYLEDAVADPVGYTKTAEVLEAGLRRPAYEGGASLIYHPGAAANTCARLPLDLTRRRVLEAGAQVVLVSSCGNGWGGTVFEWNAVQKEARPRGYQGSPQCGPDFQRAEYDNFIVRYFEDSTWLATTPASSTDEGLTPQTVAAMTRCGVDVFGLDQILPEDGRLENFVWTWTAADPPSDDNCAVQRADTRWATRDCRYARRAACRLPDGRWTLTGRVVFANAASRCARAGARFDLPRTGYDNVKLREAAGTVGAVWVNRGPAGRVTARCRAARDRRVVLCRIRPTAFSRFFAAARLSRHGRTYARRRALPGARGGMVRLRSRRPLRRRAYAVTLTFRHAGAIRRLRVRFRVR